MLQFFFLSIAFNLIAGFALAFEAVSRRIRSLSALGELLNSRRVKLVVGLSVLIVGFITLFVPAWEEEKAALIIGDLIPSGVGMAMGIALLFEVFRQDAMFPSESVDKQERPRLAYRTTLGFLGMAVAILHFFLPAWPFL
jgi:hypothetical protein